MAIKKTEFYSSLWTGCDELRGGMNATQYKDYVLMLLFMKYVSGKYNCDLYGMIVVPQSARFDDMEDEIQILQQRLAKTSQNKQGMIQGLFTGKTRLVKPKPDLSVNEKRDYAHEQWDIFVW